MNWRQILGAVLVVAAVLSAWSAWRQRAAEAPTQPESDRSDYVMHDFEMVALDKQGKESLSLRAPEMHRDPADETYTITTPLFLMPDAQGRYWNMRAKTGWVSADGEVLRLLTDVVGTSPQQAAQPTTFKTSRLDVFPQQQLASTDEVVTITRPGSILQGRGFETNLQTKAYTLKSQVKSRYESPSAR